MKRFVECEDRRQGVLLPEYLDNFVTAAKPLIAAMQGESDLQTSYFIGARHQ